MSLLVWMAILSLVASFIFFYFASDSDFEVFLASMGIIFSLTCFCLVIVVSTMAYTWMAAGVKASIINKEFNTKYTQAEVFYGSDVIDTIKEIQRTRIELKGLNKTNTEVKK